ncbi:iron transporter [Chloroflexota bacterium]
MVSTFDFRAKLKVGFRAGVGRGWSSYIWICKIIVPISFLVALIQWSGWLYRADFLFEPLMRLIHLPSEAALPIIIGIVINLYATIATMAVMPFTIEQMTLIAVFTLIAHNLIAEGIIQFRSGINIAKITFIRIGVAILTVLIISPFLGDTTASITVPSELVVHAPFLEVLKGWAIGTVNLLIKIFVIIMVIMIMLETLRQSGWIEYLFRFSKPFMKFLGLSNRTAILWVTAVAFGLLYGGAVIVEEVKQRDLTKSELEHLHISIGINHSMVEDPSLFLALGLNAFWLWVPKFLMAAITVQAAKGLEYLKKRINLASSG